RRVSIDTRSPWAARNLGHPGEKSLVSPLAQENRSILRDSDECRTRANWLFRFGCLYWKFFRVTGFQRHAIVVKRADRTSRTPRRAYGRAQIHHGLRKVSGPLDRSKLAHERADFRFCRRQGRIDCVKP